MPNLPYWLDRKSAQQYPPSTRAVVLREDGKVLLLKRTANSSLYPSAWSLPGGVWEKGESAEQGARRETLEEAGLVLGKPIASQLAFQFPGGHGVAFLFVAPTGNVLLDKSENADYGWYLPSQLPTPLFPQTAELVNRLLPERKALPWYMAERKSDQPHYPAGSPKGGQFAPKSGGSAASSGFDLSRSQSPFLRSSGMTEERAKHMLAKLEAGFASGAFGSPSSMDFREAVTARGDLKRVLGVGAVEKPVAAEKLPEKPTATDKPAKPVMPSTAAKPTAGIQLTSAEHRALVNGLGAPVTVRGKMVALNEAGAVKAWYDNKESTWVHGPLPVAKSASKADKAEYEAMVEAFNGNGKKPSAAAVAALELGLEKPAAGWQAHPLAAAFKEVDGTPLAYSPEGIVVAKRFGELQKAALAAEIKELPRDVHFELLSGAEAWRGSLPKDEAKVAHDYQSPFYAKVNGPLRAGQSTREADLLTSAVDRTQAGRDLTVFRGVVDKGLFESVHEGGSVTDPAFQSTSLSPAKALQLGRYKQDRSPHAVLFKVDVPKGTKAAYLGSHKEFGALEKELLLQRGTTLDIRKVELLPDGTKLVHARVR